jgi:hypothetical protein
MEAMARMSAYRTKWIKTWGKYGGMALVAAAIVVLPRWSGQSLLSQVLPPLPAPEEASQQAEQMSPEQLADIQIDEALRDRLRFDPEWQPILRTVQQDIMILKWGNNQLDNPAWQRYGAKLYPLLDYYTQSNDPTRQAYGMVGIRSLGKPYTVLWLERQLQRRSSEPDFYLITGNPAIILDPNANAPYEVDWQAEFGLDDPATRDRLVQLAQANLEPVGSSDYDANYYGQFNLIFLQTLLGYDAVPRPTFSRTPNNTFDPTGNPAIEEWRQLEQLARPSEAQVQRAIALYKGLSASAQEYLLVTQLGQVNAGAISPVAKALLQVLANTADSSDRVWAIAELDRHNDPQGSAMLQEMLNGDLKPLASLTKWAGYETGVWAEGSVDRPTHAYYLLINIVQKYPRSRFVRAAREYGNLTGRSYFGGEPRSPIIRDRMAQQTPQQRVASWQTWLDRYPDHPGADDAAYFLARSLQDDGQILKALDVWVQLMLQPRGDEDASYLAYPHVRTLLDVGLTASQLELLVEQYRDSAIRPLFQYALAVHYAREQQYGKAIAASNQLDLTTMSDTVLDSYYSPSIWWRSRTEQQQAMQTMLTEQRQRWQRLQQLQADNTPEARYELASDWAEEGGWKNGYLPVWEGYRTYRLPTGDWGNRSCQEFWVCNTELRGYAAVLSSYQQGSRNAIALQLYQALLDDPQLPGELREKTLFMAASNLLWQWENYPLGETFRIHPPAGVQGNLQTPSPSADLYDQWETRYNQVEQDYINYLDKTVATLKTEFPQSRYIDDLLFSRYAISGSPQFLQQIVEQYPNGDRAVEAQFLLANRALGSGCWEEESVRRCWRTF